MCKTDYVSKAVSLFWFSCAKQIMSEDEVKSKGKVVICVHTIEEYRGISDTN
jgi:hypothetical protein